MEFLTIWRITQTSYFGAVLFSDSILVWSAHACTNIPISVRTQTPKIQLNLTIRQPLLYRHLSCYTATRFVPLKYFFVFLLNNPFNADPNVLISFLKFTSLMWPLKSSKYFKGRTRNANEQNTSWGNRQIIENSIESVHEFFLFSSQLK